MYASSIGREKSERRDTESKKSEIVSRYLSSYYIRVRAHHTAPLYDNECGIGNLLLIVDR